MSRFALAALVSIVTVGCGGNSNAPTSVPNVQGFYHGGYAVTSCVPTAFISANTCPPPGVEGPFNLRVTQSDRSLQAFVGICGSEIKAATGSVGTGGVIALSGQDAVDSYPLMLSTFQASVSRNSMTGTFACTTNPGTAYSVSMTGTLKMLSWCPPIPIRPPDPTPYVV